MKPIVFFPISDENMPSSRYRVFFVENELRKRGYNTFIVPAYFTNSQKRVVLKKIPENSILYIQKAGSTFHIPDNFLPYKNKYTIIFDFDDYISVPQLHNMCCTADYIVCGSHFLYEYAKKFSAKSVLVECCQDQLANQLERVTIKNKKLRIVWSHCFAEVYAGDLLSISKILSELYRKFNFELILCGFRNTDGGVVKKSVKEKLPFAKLYDALPVEEYNRKILPLIAEADIAIVPFLDDPSRKGKAGFMLRNYMGMGIPAVASAVGEHNYMIEDGKNGFIAHNEADWKKYLFMLCENFSVRRNIGQKAKIDISKKYSLKSRVDLLEQIFEDADLAKNAVSCHNEKKSCAVVLGKMSGSNGFVFQPDVNGDTALHYIELFLLNTGCFNKVIFALPDDSDHRNLSNKIIKNELDIQLGNIDDTTSRFLDVSSDGYDCFFRFTLETPFIDKSTTTQMLSLLKYADAVNSTDEPWGINVQGYSRKLIDYLKSKKNIGRKPLWQTVDKMPEFQTCNVPFLCKPQYENIKCTLEYKSDVNNLNEFILSSEEIVFEKYQKFLIEKLEIFNQSVYGQIKRKKMLLPKKPVVCCVSVYQSNKNIKTDKQFSIILHQDENKMFYHDDLDGLHIGMPFSEMNNEIFLDLVIRNISVWCESKGCSLICSEDTFSVMFAVRLSNLLNLPVYCYLDNEIDPQDLMIIHYLKMADKVFGENADFEKLIYEQVPRAGLEPARNKIPRDFKSLASANFATPAL